jgi:uncharacterized membrane protein
MISFAYPLPWWALLLALAVIGWLAWGAYARPPVPMTGRRRATLAAFRALTLVTLVVFLMEPVSIDPEPGRRNAVVPILIDASRSMGLVDADGQRRIDRASSLVRETLLPDISREYRTDVFSFGEALRSADPARLAADGRRSDLTAAIRATRDRYRGQSVAAIVVVSDGGDTGSRDSVDAPGSGPPVFAIGVGSPVISRDREVADVSAGAAALVDSVIELSVSAVSHGFGRDPFELRVLEDGRPLQVRKVVPEADGSPVRVVFQVSPKREGATLYTVEIPEADSELAPENNRRSVVVRPPGRPRRVLIVQGAPGFEHSFLTRTWLGDPGLEMASVVRKGQNDRGRNTFYVQAAPLFATALGNGYPETREALFAYDAIVLANLDESILSRDQLAMTSDFVAQRGGGLLVLGALSFSGGGFAATPLEEVLPVELTDRRGDLVRAASGSGEPNRVALTPDGERHPVTQLGATGDDSRQRWAALPSLASSAPVGGPRPGASVLAVVNGPGGMPRPLVGVQRYGRGRSMLFAGEASWRWRMMAPSADRSYERFWRQAIRWLSAQAPDAVSLSITGGATPGESLRVDTMMYNAAFEPVRDGAVTVEVIAPGGVSSQLHGTVSDVAAGIYRAEFRPEQPGVYRFRADARQGGKTIGAPEEWALVGGADLELADPRLNEEVLRRLAAASGGRYVPAAEAEGVVDLLRQAVPDAAPARRRDLWHGPWMFTLLVMLLCGEWILRRQSGMR